MSQDTGGTSVAQHSLRYEIKMACQESAYERLLAVLRLDPAAIRKLYPPRRVQSIYLDTPTGKALEENLAGISHREKIRVRFYGGSALGVRAVLERKVRENALGWKDTLRLSAPIDVEGVTHRSFLEQVKSASDSTWRSAIEACLEPVQWISYVRDYFRTADGRVRITIDRKLQAADLRHSQRLSFRLRTHLPRITVIEAKCAAKDYDAAQAILSRLPLFVDRCSKFVLASDREHGPEPSVFPL